MGYENAPQFSYRKAAERIGVTEGQLEKIVKAGKITETDSGLIDGQSLAAWVYARKEVDTGVYLDRQSAIRKFESDSGFARQRVTQEALEHFEKDLKAFADAKWEEWHKKALKEHEARLAEIETRRVEKLKELGAALPGPQEG
jgi:hypothetical protein